MRAKTLLSLAREEGYSKIDAIKLDIEGAEDLVLDPFLSTAPRALWPRLIVMEFALLRVGAQLEQRLRGAGLPRDPAHRRERRLRARRGGAPA